MGQLWRFGAPSASLRTVEAQVWRPVRRPRRLSSGVAAISLVVGVLGFLAPSAAAAGAPQVTSISPNTGATTGGTSVTITGSGLTGASMVDFGAVAATGFAVISDTSVTATSPAGTGTVNITVQTPSGTSATSSADQFTYKAPPTVSHVSPSSGPSSGGTSVTITGTDLSATMSVDFGSAGAAGFVVNSATSVAATSPAGSGTVDITVQSAYGTSSVTSADQFIYDEPSPPTVSGISPASGSPLGGTTVTITGANLTGALAVNFNAQAATGFTVVSDTTVTATSPPGTGTVDVTVQTPSGTSTTSFADQFTYEAPPTVTGLSPSSGPSSGGTSVTISGTNLSGAMAVDFGPKAASYTVVSDTTVTATSPTGTGTADVTVQTPSGTSATSSADKFTYEAPPTVTGISPASARTAAAPALLSRVPT